MWDVVNGMVVRGGGFQGGEAVLAFGYSGRCARAEGDLRSC